MPKMSKTSSNDDLPDEILTVIFSKLPLKSIGKCKCLSKSWNSSLSTPQFTTSLLARNYPQKLLFLTNSLQTVPTPFHNDDVLSKKIEFQPEESWTKVVGSCNGLVLLSNGKGELCLINPLTTEKVNIPETDLALEKCRDRIRTHGFGYDTCADDYKIVTLSYYDSFNGPASKYTHTFVDVYSVRNRVWKRFGIFPYKDFIPARTTGVFVNGALHWLTYRIMTANLPYIIAAFDLAHEVFYEIKPPFTGTSFKSMSRFKKLLVRQGCLCLAPSYYGPSHCVWTMEEYGVAESWRELAIPVNDAWRLIQPSCFVGEDQVVLETMDHCILGENRIELGRSMEQPLVVYDVKDGTKKRILVDGVPIMCKDACIFVESLVPIG